jgi:hypothetical protein
VHGSYSIEATKHCIERFQGRQYMADHVTKIPNFNMAEVVLRPGGGLQDQLQDAFAERGFVL